MTQGGSYGRVVTYLDLDVDILSGDVVSSRFKNTLVDRDASVTPHYGVQAVVEAYASNIAPLAEQPAATLLGPALNVPLAAAAPVGGVTGEKPAGDLMADAMLAATSEPGFGEARIALLNPGGARADYASPNGSYPFVLSYADLYKAQPFGNHLVTMSLTAQQLKDALEMQFPGGGCVTPSGVNRQSAVKVLQPSNGFSFSWSASAPACRKIVEASLTVYAADGAALERELIVSGGEVVNPGAVFRVTVNDFMAGGGDNYAVFALGGKPLVGIRDVEATLRYLARFRSPSAGMIRMRLFCMRRGCLSCRKKLLLLPSAAQAGLASKALTWACTIVSVFE